MSKSDMQHQREIDDAAEIAAGAEKIGINMAAALMSGASFSVGNVTYDHDDVVEKMVAYEGFNYWTFALDRIPTLARFSLSRIKEKAVQELVNRADLTGQSEEELNRSEAA
jgi:hypothetical protein